MSVYVTRKMEDGPFVFDLVVSIGSNSKLASFVEVAYVMGKCCCTIIYEN